MVGSEVPQLEIKYPLDYPHESTVVFTVHCPSLARGWMERLVRALTCLATAHCGELVVMNLYQKMREILGEWEQAMHMEKQSQQTNRVLKLSGSPNRQRMVLGRRALYSHHIISSTKRACIREWVKELTLGGFSKIGWPGVIIVEGAEVDVQEFVRRLQHMRWKQLVVRGEQTVSVELPSMSLEALRCFPSDFYREFPDNGMSDAAKLCREVGLEDLFLSVMKIYRPVSH